MSLKLTYHSPTLLPPNVICQFYAQRSFYRKIRSLRVWLTQEGKTSNILKLEMIKRMKRKQTTKELELLKVQKGMTIEEIRLNLEKLLRNQGIKIINK